MNGGLSLPDVAKSTRRLEGMMMRLALHSGIDLDDWLATVAAGGITTNIASKAMTNAITSVTKKFFQNETRCRRLRRLMRCPSGR